MTTFPALSAADQIAAMEARAETERTIYGQTTVPEMLRQGAAWGREVERLREEAEQQRYAFQEMLSTCTAMWSRRCDAVYERARSAEAKLAALEGPK